jgi:phosphohistidine phosphatase
MNKTITLIRHAKSSWSDLSLSDFDRPLNKRGVRDAPRIATALSEQGISFDKVLCSAAQRARQTLALLKQHLDINEAIIEYQHELYGASADRLLSCIAQQPESVQHIALLGHNPGVEDLADRLSKVAIGPMPTCCVVQLSLECTTWSILPPHCGNFVLQLKPKEL